MTPFVQSVGEVAPTISKFLFPALTQLDPKVYSGNYESKLGDVLWAIDEPESNKNGGKVEKAQFGKKIINTYEKIDDFLNPRNKWEKDHPGSRVIGGVGPAAMITPFTVRIPNPTSIDKIGAQLIKAEYEKQKVIEAATKAGKYYVEPKPSDLDVDKLPKFIDNTKDYIIKLKDMKLTK